ncbi:hypothetical protein D5039_00165 [Verminephrobacter aporrectodeae subsp. tuberculatae]|uniref:Uncharacterized protein n=1 Tax=Verminephrobacter aporrectodeae subsp. tuberculatae TaxID=1110392 RepID=A0ABT3KMW5_9BURK|nr:hypothetical protein [Verminephrobacter aporrectodeae]MCW5319649.1 hypothetical protein [Verminephrobacter aporrectodeae subsp. tuberculatae]
MKCPECTKADSDWTHDVYRMQCLQCCARLVAAAQPLHMETILQKIASYPGAPGRDAILECVLQVLTKTP